MSGEILFKTDQTPLKIVAKLVEVSSDGSKVTSSLDGGRDFLHKRGVCCLRAGLVGGRESS